MATIPHPDSHTYWCHECKAWQPTRYEPLGGVEHLCALCGETILCDECGQPWTDDHDCGVS